MTARIRLLLPVLACLALLGTMVGGGSAQAAGSHGMTVLRLELSTTSDWATVTLDGITARVQRTVDSFPGATVTAKAAQWTLVPATGQQATLVVDLVSSPGSTPALTLEKGMDGIATARLTTRNPGRASTTAADVSLTTHERSSNSITMAIDPARLDIGGLVVPWLDPRRLTMAFYYPWFGPKAPAEWSIAPDKPTSPYDTQDPTEVSRMVGQAIDAGLDGFVVSWDGAPHENATRTLLTAAAARPGFLVAPLLELNTWISSGLLGKSTFNATAAAAATRSFFADAPAGSVLRTNGRPVMFTFGMWNLSPSDWRVFRAALIDLNPFIVGDRITGDYAVDGFYNYDPNTRTIPGLEARNDDGVNLTRLQSVLDPSIPQRLWAATASPGFDNRASAPLFQRRWTDRESGARYDDTWRLAIDSAPEWVVVTSWNEWYEQTHIAPGILTGTRALTQTAFWTSRFRSS